MPWGQEWASRLTHTLLRAALLPDPQAGRDTTPTEARSRSQQCQHMDLRAGLEVVDGTAILSKSMLLHISADTEEAERELERQRITHMLWTEARHQLIIHMVTVERRRHTIHLAMAAKHLPTTLSVMVVGRLPIILMVMAAVPQPTILDCLPLTVAFSFQNRTFSIQLAPIVNLTLSHPYSLQVLVE